MWLNASHVALICLLLSSGEGHWIEEETHMVNYQQEAIARKKIFLCRVLPFHLAVFRHTISTEFLCAVPTSNIINWLLKGNLKCD